MKENLRNIPVDVWRQECAEKDAIGMENYDSTFVPLFGDQEIRRAWTELPCDDIPSYIKYFEEFTSADNDTAQYFVDDPRIDNQICVGRYRHAFTIVRRHQNTELAAIVQVLRKGFIQQLVADVGGVPTLTWGEARIADTKQLAGDAVTPNTPADYLHVTFPYCSPDHIHAIEASIEALPPDAFHPMIRGTDHGIMNRMVLVSKPEEDGSFTLHLFLANPRFSLNEYRRLQTRDQELIYKHYRVPKFMAQAIEDAWRARGRSCDSNYNDTDGYCDIVLSERGDFVDELTYEYAQTCRFNRRRIARWGLDVAAKDALIAQYQNGTAGQNVSIDAAPDGNGRFNVIIEIVIEIAFHVEKYLSGDSAGRSVFTEEYLGYRIEDVPNPPVQSEGVTVIRRKEKKDNCTWDVRDEDSHSKPIEAHGRVVAAGYVEDITNRDHADEDLGIAVPGSILEAQNLPEEDGKKTVRLRLRTNQRQTVGVAPDPAFISRETYNEQDITQIVKSDVLGVNPPNAQTGLEVGGERFIERVQAEKGDDGKVTHVKVHTKKKKLTLAAYYDSLRSDTILGTTKEKLGIPIPADPNQKAVIISIASRQGQVKRAQIAFDKETGTLDVTEVNNEDQPFTPETEVKIVDGFLFDLLETHKVNTKPGTTPAVPASSTLLDNRKNISVNSDSGTVNEVIQKQVDKAKKKELVQSATYGDGSTVKVSFFWNQGDISDALNSTLKIGEFYRLSGPTLNPVTGSWHYELEFYKNVPHEHPFETKAGKKYVYYFNQIDLEKLEKHNSFANLSYNQEYGTWTFLCEGEPDDDGVTDLEKYTEITWYERVEDRRRITNPTFGEPLPYQGYFEYDPTIVDTLAIIDQKRIFTFKITEWICKTRDLANDKIDGQLYAASGTGVQQLADDEFRALLIQWWADTGWISDGPTHDYGHLNE